MVTGASTADLAVDPARRAQRGARAVQAPRVHRALLGIPQLVVAVNKMDLVDYSQERFEELVAEFESFARKRRARGGRQRDHLHPDLGAERRQRRRALASDVVVTTGARRCWTCSSRSRSPTTTPTIGRARFPVQWVIRPADARRSERARATTAATRASSPAGRCAAGDEVTVLPSGGSARGSPRSTPTTASSRRRWRRCR